MQTDDAGKIADILEGAADGLEVHGWCQRQAVARDGRRCLVSAVTLATVDYHKSKGTFGTSGPVLQAVSQHLDPGRFGPRYANHLLDWNDRRGRQAGEVIEALRVTAKELRNGVQAVDPSWFTPDAHTLTIYDSSSI